MYDILEEISMYKLYSSKLSAEIIHEEIEVLQSNRDINAIKLSIVNLDRISITINSLHNKIFFEFIMYLIYIDEIADNLEELYDDYITTNGLYDELKNYYSIIGIKHRELVDLLHIYGSTLQFVGWMEGRNLNLSCDAVFITGYEEDEYRS